MGPTYLHLKQVDEGSECQDMERLKLHKWRYSTENNLQVPEVLSSR